MEYAFSEECSIDAVRLMNIPEFIVKSIEVGHNKERTDFFYVIETDHTLDEVRDFMRQVDDGHVMLQTVARRDEYTGHRDYDLV